MSEGEETKPVKKAKATPLQLALSESLEQKSERGTGQRKSTARRGDQRNEKKIRRGTEGGIGEKEARIRHSDGPPTLRAPNPSGPHPFGPPPLRAPTPSGPPSKVPPCPPPDPPTTRPTHSIPTAPQQQTPHQKKKLAKCGLAKCGQIRMAKSGLAKCGRDLSACMPVCTLVLSQCRLSCVTQS